jgi:hypothetical protein
VRRSPSTPSTTRSSPDRRAGARRDVDVYLLPAVVGGGRGDVEEVLLVGRSLARSGYRVEIARDRPLPLLDDPSFDRTAIHRTRGVAPAAPRAVTIASQFGITAADGRDEPLGRAGPWALERAEIDRVYGPDRVLHVSLEEFARARPARELAEERWRESGRSARELRRRRRSPEARRERSEFVALYRKFRALDRPDLLALFPTFRRSAAFAREFPEAVQTGPLWPERAADPRSLRDQRMAHVLWYASPSTSDRLAPRLLRGLERTGRPVSLLIASPRRMELPAVPGVRARFLGRVSPRAWRGAWSRAHLVIATGTRTLLEAIQSGRPFLYFNGVLGRGRSARRHRPEKIDGWRSIVGAVEEEGVSAHDLADFARLRRVEEIVAKAIVSRGPRRPPIAAAIGRGFPEPFGDGLRLIHHVVERFAAGPDGASELVRAVRAESRRRPRKLVARLSKV